MEPTTFGPYRLEGELGRGPSGVVHRARDTAHDDRAVALRILTPELSADAAVRARFLADAAALSAVREPHVVPVHAYGDIGGRLYLDMRLARGPSLAAALAHGPLAPDRARNLAGQIGSAVEALRRAGLGTRPITRDDVLLTGAGRSEFVQVVGLGIGGPPADPRAVLPPERLVLPPAGAVPLPAPRPRRLRWPIAVAAVAALAVGAAVAVAMNQGGGGAGPATAVTAPVLTADASGLVTTIAGSAGVDSNVLVAALDGRPVVVAALDDATIGTWDLVTGEPARPPVAQLSRAIAIVELDGRTVLAAQADDATIRMYDLDTGAPVGPVIGARIEPAGAAVLFPGSLRSTVVDGEPVLIVRAPSAEYILETPPPGYDPDAPNPDMLYRASDGTPAGAPFTVAGDPEPSIVPTTVDGRAFGIALADTDGNITPDMVAAVDLVTREPLAPPTATQPAGFVGLPAAAERDGAPVAIVGGYDNLVRIIDLRTGLEVAPPLSGHTQAVTAVSTFPLGDRTVLRTTGSTFTFDEEPIPAETRYWDLETGAAIGAPQSGHPLRYNVVHAQVGDRTALVGFDDDRTLTVWDAATVMGP